jgi:hypothetical protein
MAKHKKRRKAKGQASSFINEDIVGEIREAKLGATLQNRER